MGNCLVTKLKAVVNNDNLEALLPDGSVVNKYVRKHYLKCVELGYTPTTEQIVALQNFTNNGIENGWIDDIKYLLPFVGSKSVPLAGAVPLIDRVGNYSMSEYPTNYDMDKAFDYNGDAIKSLGYASNDAVGGNQVVLTPIQSSDMHGGYSMFFSLKPNAVFGGLGYIADSGSNSIYEYIKNDNYHQIVCGDTALTINIVNATAIGSVVSNGSVLNIGTAIWAENGVGKYQAFAYSSGVERIDQYARIQNWGAVDSLMTPNGKLSIKYPGQDVRCNKIPMFVMAVYDAKNLTEAKAIAFSDAVMSLNVALGRI